MIEHTNLQCKTHNKVLHNACHLSFFQQYPFPIKNLHKIFSIRSCNERVLEPNTRDTTWRNIWAYVINKTETKKHSFIFHEFSCLCTGVMFSLCIVRFFYKWINNKNKSLLHTSHCVWIFIIECRGYILPDIGYYVPRASLLVCLVLFCHIYWSVQLNQQYQFL